MWRDVPSLLIGKNTPSEFDSGLYSFPEVFTACAVTCAMSCVSGDVDTENDGKHELKPVRFACSTLFPFS